MAKKTIWKDNSTPPTNYIWMRTDASGNVIGVYEYTNGSWVKIAAGRGINASNGTVLSNNGSVDAVGDKSPNKSVFIVFSPYFSFDIFTVPNFNCGANSSNVMHFAWYGPTISFGMEAK